MIVTLELSPESQAALEAQAQARTYAGRMAAGAGRRAHTARINRTPAADQSKGMARKFDEWVNSHDPNLPVLSEQAKSRESIYPDHV